MVHLDNCPLLRCRQGIGIRRGHDSLARLDRFKGRDLYDPKNRLTPEQLAKGWSVVCFLILDDAKKFAEFYDDAKNGPGDSPVEREVSAVIKHYGSYRKIEERYRGSLLGMLWPILTPILLLVRRLVGLIHQQAVLGGVVGGEDPPRLEAQPGASAQTDCDGGTNGFSRQTWPDSHCIMLVPGCSATNRLAGSS